MLLDVDTSEANLVVIFEKSPTFVGVVMHLLSVSRWRSSDIGWRFSENAIKIFRVRDRNLRSTKSWSYNIEITRNHDFLSTRSKACEFDIVIFRKRSTSFYRCFFFLFPGVQCCGKTIGGCSIFRFQWNAHGIRTDGDWWAFNDACIAI